MTRTHTPDIELERPVADTLPKAHTSSSPDNAIVISKDMSNAPRSNGLSSDSDTNFEDMGSKPCAVDTHVDWRGML